MLTCKFELTAGNRTVPITGVVAVMREIELTLTHLFSIGKYITAMTIGVVTVL